MLLTAYVLLYLLQLVLAVEEAAELHTHIRTIWVPEDYDEREDSCHHGCPHPVPPSTVYVLPTTQTVTQVEIDPHTETVIKPYPVPYPVPMPPPPPPPCPHHNDCGCGCPSPVVSCSTVTTTNANGCSTTYPVCCTRTMANGSIVSTSAIPYSSSVTMQTVTIVNKTTTVQVPSPTSATNASSPPRSFSTVILAIVAVIVLAAV